MITLDTETCGLHGMPVLLQWAEDDGPIQLHSIWENPMSETLELIEWIASQDVCGFNLAFDWFHLCKVYTTFTEVGGWNRYPEDIIDEVAVAEERARFSDFCLKPKAACDIMLLARRGPFQSLMDRDDIKIRRIPTAMAWILARELESRILFDDIYFARSKEKGAPRWKVYDVKKPDGTTNVDFKDVCLKFKASTALKNLYRHVFKIKEEVRLFKQVEPDKRWRPEELGYAPYALAIGKPDKWNWAWPQVIHQHILHWRAHEEARIYAADDVRYTRRLYVEHFKSPAPGDVDSDLACMVAACRWKGYAVDIPYIQNLKQKAIEKIAKIPQAPKQVRRYITQVMDDIEKLALLGSTKKVALEEITHWVDDSGQPHPAAIRAQEVLEARQAKKEIEIYDKLLLARRLHASFKIIGARSGRMSGADGFNPQGIQHTDEVRAAFTLADSKEDLPSEDQEVLCAGDFKSFEVTIADKVVDDPKLHAALLSGQKVHCLMGVKLFPGKTYDDIKKSEGTRNDMYLKGKQGFFLKCYRGNAYTFNKKIGIPMDVAEKANKDFNNEFQGFARFEAFVDSQFGALSQPGGIGTRVEWREPKEFAESFLGFRRYFTLEIRLARTLFEMAQKPPPSLKNTEIKVIRRERIQTAGGAIQSALYGAAFSIVSAMLRAAQNHYIQSPGAEICKRTQYAIWKIQPCGVHKWLVRPMNIHDELECPTRRGYEDQVREAVQGTVESHKEQVPLLAIDWVTGSPNWAGKKNAGVSTTRKSGESVS